MFYPVNVLNNQQKEHMSKENHKNTVTKDAKFKNI